jgi:hypothetical protein
MSSLRFTAATGGLEPDWGGDSLNSYSEWKLREQLDYMHANPVKRGPVSSPEGGPGRASDLTDGTPLLALVVLFRRLVAELLELTPNALAHLGDSLASSDADVLAGFAHPFAR